MTTLTKQELQAINCNGFKWIYNEDGAHFFSKCLNERTQDSFALIRCLPEDMTNGNFEYFCKHGLTNNNPVKKVRSSKTAVEDAEAVA